MALSEPTILPEDLPPGCGRLGIFGGTFDPIHIGHLIAAEEARARLGLDCVVFVPARVSPLKVHNSFAAADRLRMVELATADNPHFRVSPLELEREGPSYTVDTLQALHRAFGPAMTLYFVMGADSLEHLRAWHRPTDILRLARLAVLSRPGYLPDLVALERELPGIRGATDLIPTLQIGISATDIRRRLRQGLPIRYQVPADVEAYIRSHDLVKELGGIAR